MTENYASNSNKSKALEADKKIDKVVTGTVKTKKRTGFDKFKDEFISQDAKNIKTYVVGDVLIPAIKKALTDIVTNGINILLYGEAKRDNGRSISDRVSYRSYYDTPRSSVTRASNVYDYDDIILESKSEADEVLARMDELMATYGLVRVADLYDLVGITGNFTDNKYGWTNIRSAEVVHVRDGWTIKMPRAVPID